MPARARVALVIPAWTDSEAIGAVLEEIPPDTVDQVVVVVGGESDPTAPVAAQHGAQVLVQRQAGYGAACGTGAEAAIARGATIVAFLDGDHADPPAELVRVLAPLLNGEADLVLGCRDVRRFPAALPMHARLGNRLVLLLLRLLIGARFTDLPSFKAIDAEALHRLAMREMTYGWTVEMLAKSARAGLRIQEVDIEYRPRLGGRSKVAGSVGGSLRAATRLLGCAVTYATSSQWSVASGQ
jgi:glycosyltransferase involved in cell wall biosynthesis